MNTPNSFKSALEQGYYLYKIYCNPKSDRIRLDLQERSHIYGRVPILSFWMSIKRFKSRYPVLADRFSIV